MEDAIKTVELLMVMGLVLLMMCSIPIIDAMAEWLLNRDLSKRDKTQGRGSPGDAFETRQRVKKARMEGE